MRVNRLLRILFLVALFRSANLPLRSLEAPPSCLGPHPKHRDRALLSRYRDTIARIRAFISMISNQIPSLACIQEDGAEMTGCFRAHKKVPDQVAVRETLRQVERDS